MGSGIFFTFKRTIRVVTARTGVVGRGSRAARARVFGGTLKCPPLEDLDTWAVSRAQPPLANGQWALAIGTALGIAGAVPVASLLATQFPTVRVLDLPAYLAPSCWWRRCGDRDPLACPGVRWNSIHWRPRIEWNPLLWRYKGERCKPQNIKGIKSHGIPRALVSCRFSTPSGSDE
jgi:hypothetical protein